MLEIRDVKSDDAADLLYIYDHYVRNTAITFEYETPTLTEFKGRIERITAKYPYIVALLNGKVAGYAYAGVFKDRAAYDRSVEMTVYVDKDLRKSGIGRALYEALEERLKNIGILNLYACIGYPEKEDEYLDRNSARFHEHMGYTLAGRFHKCGYKFGRWYDMIWMEKMIGTHD